MTAERADCNVEAIGHRVGLAGEDIGGFPRGLGEAAADFVGMIAECADHCVEPVLQCVGLRGERAGGQPRACGEALAHLV